jgi:hypothetical protein
MGGFHGCSPASHRADGVHDGLLLLGVADGGHSVQHAPPVLADQADVDARHGLAHGRAALHAGHHADGVHRAGQGGRRGGGLLRGVQRPGPNRPPCTPRPSKLAVWPAPAWRAGRPRGGHGAHDAGHAWQCARVAGGAAARGAGRPGLDSLPTGPPPRAAPPWTRATALWAHASCCRCRRGPPGMPGASISQAGGAGRTAGCGSYCSSRPSCWTPPALALGPRLTCFGRDRARLVGWGQQHGRSGSSVGRPGPAGGGQAFSSQLPAASEKFDCRRLPSPAGDSCNATSTGVRQRARPCLAAPGCDPCDVIWHPRTRLQERGSMRGRSSGCGTRGNGCSRPHPGGGAAPARLHRRQCAPAAAAAAAPLQGTVM